MCIMEEFEKEKTAAECQGDYYKLSDVIKILILGLLSKQQTMEDIHGWAKSKSVKEMLDGRFDIKKLPCYSQFTNIIGIMDSDELNKIFMELFEKLSNITEEAVFIDGKFDSPLHAASAFVAENGITIGQLTADAKSGEIPSVQELIRLLNIKGATVVADALNCQKDTVKEIMNAGANYVLSVKKNQKELHSDIEDMINFKLTDEYEQRNSPMEAATKIEVSNGRIERITALATGEVEWLQERGEWQGVSTIGAIITESQTRYYISSRILSAEQLLSATRSEWVAESTCDECERGSHTVHANQWHWRLDVIFDEDRTAQHEKNSQATLDILLKSFHDTGILADVPGEFNDCV